MDSRIRSNSPGRAGRKTSTLSPDEQQSAARLSSRPSSKSAKISADPELVDRVRALLKQYLHQLEVEHSYVVKNHLRMAMQAVKADGHGGTKPDKRSPFHNMTPIHSRQKANVRQPCGWLSVRTGTFTSKTSNEHKIYFPETTAAVPESMKDRWQTIPKFHEYTTLRNNIVVEDDEEMRYHPYLGEDVGDDGKDADTMSLNLEEAYIDKTKNASEEAKQIEKAILYADFLHRFLAEAGVEIECIKSYLIGDFFPNSNSMRKTRDMCLPEDFDFSDPKILSAAAGLNKYPISDLKRAEVVCKVFMDITKISLWEVVKRVDLGLQASINPMRSTGADKAGTVSERERQSNLADSVVLDLQNPFDSYAYMYCQICHMFKCQFHEDVFESLSAHIPKYCTRKEAVLNPLGDRPCSAEDCFLSKNSTHNLDPRPLTPTEINIIATSCQILASNPRAACLISTVLRKPCYQIHAILRENNLLKPLDEDEDLFDLEEIGMTRYGTTKRKRHGILESYPSDCKFTATASERDNPKPCHHSGPCGPECPCVIAKVVCEKFCLCDKNCSRRWKGCSCHAAGTPCLTSTKCDCMRWGRECDPDLCKSCGTFDGLCRNVPIQQDKMKRTLIGISNISGIGLFIGEDVNKDEYLGEYKGEIISHNEAERRGKLYDTRRVSFLFNLNRAQAVDATRAGNKFRFVNHYSKPNCYARISLVGGVHRIGLYAKRKLYAGEELYFDYGYGNKTVEFVAEEPKYYFEPPNKDWEYQDADSESDYAEGEDFSREQDGLESDPDETITVPRKPSRKRYRA